MPAVSQHLACMPWAKQAALGTAWGASVDPARAAIAEAHRQHEIVLALSKANPKKKKKSNFQNTQM